MTSLFIILIKHGVHLISFFSQQHLPSVLLSSFPAPKCTRQSHICGIKLFKRHGCILHTNFLINLKWAVSLYKQLSIKMLKKIPSQIFVYFGTLRPTYQSHCRLFYRDDAHTSKTNFSFSVNKPPKEYHLNGNNIRFSFFYRLITMRTCLPEWLFRCLILFEDTHSVI